MPRQRDTAPCGAPLPMTREEMASLGWDAIDVLLVSGDAYVDHPSFGVALLGRWLAAHGFRVGIAAQPLWEGGAASSAAPPAFTSMGRPRLFAGVTAGAIDSMLAHYTAFRKKRHDDAYTPGGLAGARPNRASIVYTGLVRRCFPGLPVVLGGIEASLRRASHYDFWTDSLRRSLLLDSKADLLIYGMGERALLEVARRAAVLAQDSNDAGHDADSEAKVTREALVRACRDIRGLAWAAAAVEAREWLGAADTAAAGGAPEAPLFLPSHEAILNDKTLLMRATLELERQVHRQGPYAIQESGDRAVVITPPATALETKEMDSLYALPYTRLPHPSYTGAIPAWEMIRTSITTHRGCGGGCSFCSLALHQGRRIASRSRGSVMAEAGRIAAGPDTRTGKAPPRWAGSISDVGGPSANMWRAACSLPRDKHCRRASCMHPEVCAFFKVDQGEGVQLLREIATLPGVRHVRVASGVRFDLALREPQALYAYTAEFTGGQLKVAPEHSEDAVLGLMRKPPLRVFERFLEEFHRLSRQARKEQYTVPYLMSAFPGCTEAHMRALSGWLREKRWSPQQVQCFIPTPGTVATAMYYAETAPDGSPLYVAKTDKERLRQHHLLFDAPDGRRASGRKEGRDGRPSESIQKRPGKARKTPDGDRKGDPKGEGKEGSARTGRPGNAPGKRTGKRGPAR